MLFLRVAHAQVGYERPFGRHLQDLGDLGGIKNRTPTDSQPVRPSRQPECMYRGHSRVVKSLGHCATAQAMPGRRPLIDENGQMKWRLGKAGQLELGIERGASARVRFESVAITPS